MIKLIRCVTLLIAAQVLLIDARKVHVVELTNAWTLKNLNGSIEVPVSKIPSGVYSALKEGYGDVLLSKNDVNLRWIANETWIYNQTFDDLESSYGSMINLTFHGIDTVSNIRLNGKLLGTTQNMFVRYSFDVTNKLKPKSNALEIELLSPLQTAKKYADNLKAKGLLAPPECPLSSNSECHRNMLRKMQMSFGSEYNLAAPSMGIWKPVTIEYYEVAIARDIDVAIKRNETHWTTDVRVFLDTGLRKNFYADLTLYANELLGAPHNISTREINYASPLIEFKVHILKEKVKPWWPNGYGVQKLYPLYFSVRCWLADDGPYMSKRTTSEKSIKIGFRTIEIIEKKDVRGRTFFFQVNGHPIFVKGANFVPSHILPELSADSDRLEHLMVSAKNMHMNMLRVWGGGLYESDAFYNKADYHGLLIWQDMAFDSSTYPINEKFLESVRLETVQNAMRISHHPSLALLVTNNEIEFYLMKNRPEFAEQADRLEDEYKLLFMGTIKYELNVISRANYSARPGPMISTPSMGITEGKKALSEDPQNPNYGDVHFWEDDQDGFDPEVYPKARFISKFGYASLPLLSSWLHTLENDSLTDIIEHRQHDPNEFLPIFRLIARQLPFQLPNWKDNIEEFIYFSQIAQALTTRTAIDLFRSQRYDFNTMGALIWQLNDVWIAPTWSCIDFYGNYKIVYYWAREFMKPIRVIALYDANADNINITVTREDYSEYRDAREYGLNITVYTWDDLFPKTEFAPLSAVLDYNETELKLLKMQTVLEDIYEKNQIFVKVQLIEEQEIISTTHLLPVAVKHIAGIKDPLISISVEPSGSTAFNGYSIITKIKYPALFVYIELRHPEIERYIFSENGFIQVEPIKVVHLEFESKSLYMPVTKDHIKITTMNKYLINKF